MKNLKIVAERAMAAYAKRAYTGAMRTAWKKIRYRLEWLGLKFATKFLPLLSRKACYRLALLLGSLGAMLTDSKWKVKCLDLTPILNSLLLFWHSPRTLQVSAPRRLYSDNVGIWARPVAIVGS